MQTRGSPVLSPVADCGCPESARLVEETVTPSALSDAGAVERTACSQLTSRALTSLRSAPCGFVNVNCCRKVAVGASV